MKIRWAILFCFGLGILNSLAEKTMEKDVLPTSEGPVEITFIGHGTLMLTFKDRVIHVDPYSRLTDYTRLPKADLILLTHDHPDHLDPAALRDIRTPNTLLVIPPVCASKTAGGLIMTNGETRTFFGLQVEAIPAYNLIHKRDNGQVFHPKGVGNGYVITFGDKHLYIAGDTENIPEMKALKSIDCAFLPMNLPYTMTPEMVADAARAFKPAILYPYHFGETRPEQLIELLKDTPKIEVRIRSMK